MEQIPIWEADNAPTCQEILLSWKSKVHYHVHSRHPLGPILSQMNPVHKFTFYFFKIYFNIIFPSTPGPPMLPLTFSFSDCGTYDGVSKSFRTGRLERELQMVQLYANKCSCIAILWVSLASFAAITLCVSSQQVFIVIVVVDVFIDSIRKLLDTPSYSYQTKQHIRPLFEVVSLAGIWRCFKYKKSNIH